MLSQLWQNIVGPIAGAVVGFASAALIDLWRSRRRMRIELTGGACFYARRKSFDPSVYQTRPRSIEADGGEVMVWERTSPDDEGTSLFVRVELIAVNQSFLDDALTEAYLVLGDHDRRGVPRAFAAIGPHHFRGRNIPAHSMAPLTFMFEFDRLNHEQFPLWRYQPETIYQLVVKTIRKQRVIAAVPPFGFQIVGGPGDFVDDRIFEPELPVR